MLEQRWQTVLILDALVECEEDLRHSLMTVLSEFVEQNLHAKVLVSSRRDDDITDIMRFVKGKIEEYRNSGISRRRTVSAISSELEQKIIDVFPDKSNGM